MECWKRHVGIYNPSQDKDRLQLRKGQTTTPTSLDFDENDEDSDTKLAKWTWSDESRFIWMHGHQGAGKTTLVTALVNDLDNKLGGSRVMRLRKKLGQKKTSKTVGATYGVLAYFFFQRDHSSFSSVTSAFRSLVYQLAHQLNLDFYEYGNSRNVFGGPNAVFWLRDILQKILEDKSLPKVYFIIDAIDECTTGQEYLWDFISGFMIDKKASTNASWFITSRKKLSVDSMQFRSWDVIDLNGDDKLDISEIRNSVLRNTKTLSAQAKSTLFSDSKWSPLSISLASKALKDIPKFQDTQLTPDLSNLIGNMVDSVLTKSVTNKEILRWTTTALRPLHVDELVAVVDLQLQKDESIEELVKGFYPLLTIHDKTIYFVHSSVRDYINGSDRGILSLAPEDDHWEYTQRCIKIMEENFPKEQWSSPDATSKEPTDALKHLRKVEYACSHWVNHLTRASKVRLQTPNFEDQLYHFLEENFLHWLVVLFEMRIPDAGIEMLNELYLALAINAYSLRELIEDARRFILSNRSLIEGNPLQLYSSARMFAPRLSFTRRRSRDGSKPRWISVTSEIPKDWSPCSHSLEGHSGWVTDVAFSPDGKLIASASTDTTIKLWDALTGTICATLSGHVRPVNSVAFSPSRHFLISASNDKTIKLWKLSTTAEILGNGLDRGCCFFAPVNYVAFSEDGTMVACATNDNEINLLEWNEHEHILNLHWSLKGHIASVRQVAFSRNDRVLASASDDNTIKIWQIPESGSKNVQDWEPELTLYDHQGPVNAVAFSPDGKWLASGSDDGTVKLWAIPKYEEQTEIRLPSYVNSVYSVAFLSDGDDQLLAIASDDGIVMFWDLVHRRECGRLKGHSGRVRSVSVSQYGQLASSSNDNTIKLWDINMAQLQHRGDVHGDAVNDIAFSPVKPYRYASASDDNTVKLWDSDSGEVITTLQGHSGPVNRVAFSPDGRFIASSSDDMSVVLWEINAINAAKADVRTLPIRTPYLTLKKHNGEVLPIAFSPDSKILASGSRDNKVILWNAKTGNIIKTVEHKGMVRAIAFAQVEVAAGKISGFSGCTAGEVLMWTTEPEPKPSRQLAPVIKHTNWVRDIAITGDGKVLASASDDKTVWIYRTDNISNGGSNPRKLGTHSDWVRTISFSKDGNSLVSGSDDKTVIVWDIADSTSRLFGTHSGEINSVGFLPDGHRVVSASDDKTVKVWDKNTRTIVHDLKGHQFAVRVAISSPDGSRVVSASSDSAVKLWDMKTGRELISAKKQSHSVDMIKISPDGKCIATLSQDGMDIRLWDEKGQLCFALNDDGSQVTDIVFSQDGAQLLASLGDMGLRLWDTHTGTLIAKTLDRHSETINNIIFLSMARCREVIASCSDDSTIRLWDAELRLCHILTNHEGPVKSISLSRNGQLLASASDDCTVKLSDLTTDDRRQTANLKHKTQVKLVSFLDDRLLASVSMTNEVRIWNADTKTSEYVVQGHQNMVTAISFLAEHKLLATADNRQINVWPLKRGTRPVTQQTLHNIGPTRELTFNWAQGFLSTERGHLELKGLPTASQKTRSQYGSFYVRNRSVRAGERILRLPVEYQPTSVAVRDNNIALGHGDGSISVLNVQVPPKLVKRASTLS